LKKHERRVLPLEYISANINEHVKTMMD